MSNRNLFAAILVAFVLISGIGLGTSYFKSPPKERVSGEAPSRPSEMLTRLNDYARAMEPQASAPRADAATPLPDVGTMIKRLADRLQTTPDDIKGWRMLGWSYFNIGDFEQAAAAYAKALALDPGSTDLKRSYEEAKAKASGKALPAQAEIRGAGGDTSHVAQNADHHGSRLPQQDAAIRSMVDGLARRLEGSPRDVDGWTRLMRSRVVLGEQELAATALRKALAVFEDDQAAMGKIKAAAIELGLTAE